MNETTNDHATVTVDQVKRATAMISKVQASLKLTALTPAERIEYRRGNLRFSMHTLEDQLAQAKQVQDLLPPSFDLRQYERETKLALALGDCLNLLETVRNGVKDTFLVVGTGAARAGKAASSHIKVASHLGNVTHRTRRSPRDSAEAPAPATPAAAPVPSTATPHPAGLAQPATSSESATDGSAPAVEAPKRAA